MAIDPLLLVDLGNSRIKWAFAGNPMPVSTALDWKGEDFDRLLHERWRHLERPGAVAVSAVAPAAIRQQLLDLVAALWQVPVHFLAPQEQALGVTCGYGDPQQLGADRWAAILAAHHRYPQGALVVDCGTATTLDAIAGDRHLGGYILPGIGLMRDSLLRETAIQRSEEGEDRLHMWGRSTSECIDRGSVMAVIALVEHGLERLQAAGTCDPVLVVTGGQSGLILPAMQVDYRRHDDLVLEGTMRWAEEFLQ